MTTVSILDESKIKNIFHQQIDLDKIVDYEQRRLEMLRSNDKTKE